MADVFNIAGRIHSTSQEEVVTTTNEILDATQEKKQSEVNQEVSEELALHTNRLNALTGQNYITVQATQSTTAADIPTLINASGEGEQTDTIYRVGFWDGSAYVADKYTEYAWNGTAYVILDVKSSIGEVFDISQYNAVGGTLATYADLATALGVSGANVPSSVRRGGMSIKFIQGTVQSSDDKYVQFRYMLDDATDVSDFTNTDNWSFCGDDVYVENPEFVRVITDKEGRIVIAIEKNANVLFGAGVPQQIVDYIREKIEELSLDEYEDIVAFLDGLEEGDKTLQTLLDEKVDKDENKSLIDENFANGISYIENPEFSYVSLDSENKVLFGVQKDGNFLFGCGVPKQVIDYIEEKIAALSLDEYEDIVSFLSDYLGSDTTLKVMIDGINATIADKLDKDGLDPDALNSVQAVENPEFMEVELDADDKVLGGRKVDGTKFENNDVELNGNATVGGSLEVDSLVIKNIEDPEGRFEIATDSKNKIISYRTADGTLHENVGIVTPNITLSDEGLTDLQQALRRTGFDSGVVGDLSNSDHIELPEPKHYALVNLIIPAIPKNESVIAKGYAEYYDNYGNYFKIPCEIATQGQSSQYFASTGGKGNYTLDIDRDVKFGSWVPQDSFHLKGCAKDVTRGFLSTSYKWAYKMMNVLDAKPNRVLMDESSITTTNATGNRFTDWPSDARCLPDGFPIELYVNSEYIGLYALQLKKHRKNYSMNKSDYTTFFIDADNLMPNGYQTGFWLGDIPWTRFEIKNPKDLYCMDGSKYDGDNPKELIDSTSQYYDSSNSKHVGSAQTKAIIESFSTKYLAVKALVDTNTPESLAEAKTLFAEYFDVNSCILVYIFNCLTNNSDSIGKNTLWGTYGNGKIAAFLWDLDGVYGEGWIGSKSNLPNTTLWSGNYATAQWPLRFIWRLYIDELKAAYALLRNSKVISIDTWHDIIFNQWVERIGTEAYERDIKKWKETPSYRANYTNTNYWIEIGGRGSQGEYPIWNDSDSYSQDDQVVIKMHPDVPWYMIYKAVQANTNQCPVTKFYDGFPIVGGYYNSPKRMEKWLITQIELCDAVMDYSQQGE